MTELFRAYVMKMLKKEGLVDDSFIKMIMSWRHTSGFKVHNQVQIKPRCGTDSCNITQYGKFNATYCLSIQSDKDTTGKR